MIGWADFLIRHLWQLVPLAGLLACSAFFSASKNLPMLVPPMRRGVYNSNPTRKCEWQ